MTKLYNFQECIKYTSSEEQELKICEELEEFIEAEGLHQVEECWDIIHACETWIRNNATRGQAKRCKFNVEEKNRKRGYYE